MTDNNVKRYWKSLRDLAAESGFLAEAETEFFETPLGIEADSGRRAFLKAAGFTFAGALLTGCRQTQVEKAIPLLVQPEQTVAGRASYYASTCDGCAAGCGQLVKVRDGRPIKLEGNPQHPMSRGGLCAVGQASILGLYDSQRLREPRMNGKAASWADVDRAVNAELENIRRNRGAVRLLSETVTGPAKRWTIERFLASFGDARHVSYDPLSCSAILDAHENTHGVRALPRYRFDRAEVIAGFDADFLGTWISPVEFSRQYSRGRVPEGQPPRMSYHVQFEGRMSVTGSKADQRIRIAPDEAHQAVAYLAFRLAQKAGVSRFSSSPETPAFFQEVLDGLADRLWEARGRSLVVCGTQDIDTQVLCNFANHLLGNYGATLDIVQPSYQKQGNDRELKRLLQEIESGQIAALFLDAVNPVYELPGGRALAEALRRVPVVVSFADRVDETSGLARFVCPAHHRLESWDDAEPVSGVVSVAQPAVRPFGNTRSVLESLALWMGAPKTAYDILRESWQTQVFPRQRQERNFVAFWDRAVHDGYTLVEPRRTQPKPFDMKPMESALAARAPAGGEFSLVLYPKVGILDGRHACNPWLQELPDPISKTTWDNYACLAPATAARLELSEGDVIRIEAGQEKLELPVLVQPGQHELVVAVALGYGKKGTERFSATGPRWLGRRPDETEGGLVGGNAAPLLELSDTALRYWRSDVRLSKTGKRHPLAITQDHHTLSVPERLAPAGNPPRPIVQETTLASFRKDPKAGSVEHHKPETDLWPRDHPFTGHRWAMAIDLNACTGCAACVVACQVENNVPVVGKDEVRRKREMHWMRIDRYYSGPPDEVSVAHQPMFCQQCEHAPCETVCPVLATVHSEEGLNQQVYNRCVGTRYCANNCPYKVRRFNWFDYPRDDRLANMVLNPEVTVRSRGVMEKCTFCVQRIQEAKIAAKGREEPLADGQIQTACQQSCPAEAIVFGDMNDPKSRVSQLLKGGRAYQVLEEINVRPSVGYLRLVRNRPEGGEGKHHG